MRFLLDTNIVTAVMKKNLKVIRKVQHYGTDVIGLPSLVVYELHRGAWQVTEAGQRARLLTMIQALPFTTVSHGGIEAETAGKVQGSLLAAGKGIEDMDALIGAQAIAGGLILVTDNVRHFARMEGLHLQNWLD